MNRSISLLAAIFFVFLFTACQTTEVPSGPPRPTGSVSETVTVDDNIGPVFSLEWSPRGDVIASAGYAEVRIRDGQSGALVHLLQGHSDYVWGVAWSPQGDRLASVSQDGRLIIWNPRTGGELKRITWEEDWPFSVDWSPDGTLLAVGTEGARAVVFDTETWEEETVLSGSSSMIDIEWAGSGSYLAAAQWDGQVLVWNKDEGYEPKLLDIDSTRRHDANGLAWSPNGKTLAVAYQDRSIRLWNVETGEMERRFTGFGGWVRGVAWSSNGKMIAGAGERFTLRVWAVKKGTLIAKQRIPRDSIWSLSWSPQEMLAVGSGIYTDSSSNSHMRLFTLEN